MEPGHPLLSLLLDSAKGGYLDLGTADASKDQLGDLEGGWLLTAAGCG